MGLNILRHPDNSGLQQKDLLPLNKNILCSVIEHSTDAIIITGAFPAHSSANHEIVFVNDAWVNMTGYSKEEVTGKPLLQSPEMGQKEKDKLKETLQADRPAQGEFINRRKNGETFWAETSIFSARDELTNLEYRICIKKDITAQKKVHKEVSNILHELHHRVKNNLAITSAMMELQSMGEENEVLKEKLLSCSSRIKSMAVIHDFLYEGDSLSHINMSESLVTLCHKIEDTREPEPGINFGFNLQPGCTLNINQAVPVALIVNEVLTNTMKHALKDVPRGEICVSLAQINNRIILKIRDNGRELPGNFDPHNKETHTIGLLLIKTISQQLHATYRFISLENGTEFRLEFVKKDVKGAQSGYRTEASAEVCGF